MATHRQFGKPLQQLSGKLHTIWQRRKPHLMTTHETVHPMTTQTHRYITPHETVRLVSPHETVPPMTTARLVSPNEPVRPITTQRPVEQYVQLFSRNPETQKRYEGYERQFMGQLYCDALAKHFASTHARRESFTDQSVAIYFNQVRQQIVNCVEGESPDCDGLRRWLYEILARYGKCPLVETREETKKAICNLVLAKRDYAL